MVVGFFFDDVRTRFDYRVRGYSDDTLPVLADNRLRQWVCTRSDHRRWSIVRSAHPYAMSSLADMAEDIGVETTLRELSSDEAF